MGIALEDFDLSIAGRHDAYVGAMGFTPSPPLVRVHITVLADGADLDRLLAMLASVMPDVATHAAAQGVAVQQPRALPEANKALPPGPTVIDGILEEP